MEIYFLKSAAILASLLVFYKLLLEKENMHVFKRFYLLASVFAAGLIPLVTFTTYVETSSNAFNSILIAPETASEVIPEKTNYLLYILLAVYLLGVLSLV